MTRFDICMRTTLVLDDAVVKKAKLKAVDGGITFSEITNRALRDYLFESKNTNDESETRVLLPLYRGSGSVADISPAAIAEFRDCGF